MDNTAHIKHSLIARIKNSNDLDFLKAIQTLLDTSEHALFQLSSEEKESIDKGRQAIKNGDSIENEQVLSEMKKRLKRQ